MKLPNLSQSADTLVKEHGLYHYTRLCADATLGDMAARWEMQQSRLQGRILDFEKTRGETMTTMAARDGVARLLAEAVRAFYGALVAKTNNNRRSPLFKTYFPDGLHAVLNAPLQAEMQRVGVLVNKLAQETDPDLSAHFEPLKKVLSSLAEAVNLYDTAADSERQAFGRIEQEKFAWLDLYKLDHRTLAQAFYKDPKKADSYFKPSRKPRTAQTGPATVAAVPPVAHVALTKEASA